jgi:predicted RNA polymerase sigma factor
VADPRTVEGLLRAHAPRALGALVRRRGDFADAEDAIQESMLAAAREWPTQGIPDDPTAWLVRVGDRRLIDGWRGDSSRRRREDMYEVEQVAVPDTDDSLELLLLCCHPALTLPSQVALTLRAVGGLTTEQIARGFLVPTATIAQRISRAKSLIRSGGARFELPSPDALTARIAAVATVVYLVFTEGHTASSGDSLVRVDLADEAVRLGRLLLARVTAEPALTDQHGEAAGLLALMLLTQSRRAARTDAYGRLVPLSDQDRTRWDRALIDEGVTLITEALATAPLGPYQLQAAIAAVHAEAPSTDATDWREILGLYDLLVALAPSPMTRLNRVVALAMADGPAAGLLALDTAADDPALAHHHRSHAVRAHLLEQVGDTAAAKSEYETAASLTLSIPERRHLVERATRCG